LKSLISIKNKANPNSNYDQFINLDVNISDQSSVKRLRVGFNDDPKIIVNEFAKKYGKKFPKKLSSLYIKLIIVHFFKRY